MIRLADMAFAPNQLFTWRRLVAQGALTAAGSGEEVVPASDHRALHAGGRTESSPGINVAFPDLASEDDV